MGWHGRGCSKCGHTFVERHHIPEAGLAKAPNGEFGVANHVLHIDRRQEGLEAKGERESGEEQAQRGLICAGACGKDNAHGYVHPRPKGPPRAERSIFLSSPFLLNSDPSVYYCSRDALAWHR